jgi:hypothetical protein
LNARIVVALFEAQSQVFNPAGEELVVG